MHEIVIYVEKIDKEWFFTFMLGAVSEANGALKLIKGSSFSIQSISDVELIVKVCCGNQTMKSCKRRISGVWIHQ